VGRDADSTVVAIDRAASVLFHEHATPGRDRYDAPKFEPMAASYAALAPVASRADSALRAQESRPLPDGARTTVPLSFQRSGVGGTFAIGIPADGEAATETPSIPDGWTVELVDTKGTAAPGDDETDVLTPGGRPYTFEATGRTTASKARAAPDSSGEAVPRPTLRRLSRDAPAPTAKATTASTETAATGPRFRLTVRPAGALPVELVDLSAQRRGEQAVLTWATAAETDNAGFQVQHQRLPAGDTTAAPSAADWSTLGFVEGGGTTTAARSYRFETDALGYGRHVFRLRQVDTDGAATTTAPVDVEVRLQRPYAVEAPYPNPAAQQALLPVTVRETQQVTVTLYDVLGRRVRVAHERELRGQQTTRLPLSVRGLASGSYFVRVQGTDFSTTRRFTVVH
jgi:hypothetical protein